MAELPLPEKGQQISEHSDPPKASPGLPEPPPPAAAPFPDGWPEVPSLTVTRDGKAILSVPLMGERESFDVGPYKVGDPMTEWIEFAVRERTMSEARDVERACEAALQGGAFGVLIARRNDGTLIGAEVNPCVPYGQIYELRAITND